MAAHRGRCLSLREVRGAGIHSAAAFGGRLPELYCGFAEPP